MKAYVILRVSSREQKRGHGFESQWEDDIIPGAEHFKLEVSEQFCSRIDESASKGVRAEFTKAVKQAIGLYKKGEIDAVLFPRVDRESRDPFLSIPILTECFEAKLPVYFAREELYLDPHDLEAKQKYINEVQKSVDYVVTLTRNTKRGRRLSAKAGKIPGGSGLLFGYNFPKKTGKRQINEVQTEIVRTMFDMFEKGKSLFSIASYLTKRGVKTLRGNTFWHPSAVYLILTNPAYTGKTKYYDYQLPDATPPVITNELFERVQTRLKENRELLSGHPKYEYLLSGRVFCGTCGRRMSGATKLYGAKKYRFYQCTRDKTHSPNPCGTGMRVDANAIESEIWTKVSNWLINPSPLICELKSKAEASGIVQLQTDLIEIEVEIKRLENEKTRIHRAFLLSGDEKEFSRALIENKNSIDQKTGYYKAIQKRLEEIKHASFDLKVIYDLYKHLEIVTVNQQGEWTEDILRSALIVQKAQKKMACAVFDILKDYTFKDKRELLEACQVQVTVNKDGNKVHGFIMYPDGLLEKVYRYWHRTSKSKLSTPLR